MARLSSPLLDSRARPRNGIVRRRNGHRAHPVTVQRPRGARYRWAFAVLSSVECTNRDQQTARGWHIEDRKPVLRLCARGERVLAVYDNAAVRDTLASLAPEGVEGDDALKVWDTWCAALRRSCVEVAHAYARTRREA